MDRALRSGPQRAAILIALAIMVAFLNSPASAQVKPGDFITPDNAYKVKDLVSPAHHARDVAQDRSD